MKIRKIIPLAMSLFFASNVASQTQVIAHRGFWKTSGSAMNSLTSLTKADSLGCYGSEFDVWLTKDNQLVVNHDSSFRGKSMEKTSLAELTELKLDNGENLPSLKSYLETGKTFKTHFILELKEHSKPERETEAVKKIIAIVKRMGLETRMDYISFSLHAVKEFIRLAPAGTPVLYLKGDLSPQQLKEIGATGADYQLDVFKKNPEWITECHNSGMKVNVWTVDKEKDFKWLILQKVDFITTNEPAILKKMLRMTE
ncbi:glycerophosphodiester phosphodiesterase family protein [uncultured Bacteroides sp.]|uniref:glycerophosphodiester phosphodiesterase family protein n=1 Tax=uncultured Bacteroides sp. TaxID=162156 RepID=UPI002AA96112|nr:glycerophosphodiester phosphodiesterase family protein [uncultured Bacteroides sp.]